MHSIFYSADTTGKQLKHIKTLGATCALECGFHQDLFLEIAEHPPGDGPWTRHVCTKASAAGG